MNYSDVKEKYFVIMEGTDRAIIRDSESQAKKVKERLSKHAGGKRIYTYKSSQRSS